MEDLLLGRIVGPFVTYLMLLIALPFKVAIQVYMPQGRLKRILLYRFPRDVQLFIRIDAAGKRLLLRLLDRCIRGTKLQKIFGRP